MDTTGKITMGDYDYDYDDYIDLSDYPEYLPPEHPDFPDEWVAGIRDTEGYRYESVKTMLVDQYNEVVDNNTEYLKALKDGDVVMYDSIHFSREGEGFHTYIH